MHSCFNTEIMELEISMQNSSSTGLSRVPRHWHTASKTGDMYADMQTWIRIYSVAIYCMSHTGLSLTTELELRLKSPQIYL